MDAGLLRKVFLGQREVFPSSLDSEAETLPNIRLGPGLARTLGNLGRLAPRPIASYTGLRGVARDDSWRTNDGKDSACVPG